MQYNISLFSKECAQSMLRNLSVVNAARCFYLADLYDVQEIKKPIYEFINKNKEAFRLSDGWKQYFVPKIELIEKLFLTDYEDAGSEDDEKDGD